MKVMTILGTRPEIIRLSRIIPLLDRHCKHVLVHTGQNYDPGLYDVFFEELGLRSPDHVLKCRSSTLMAQIGKILYECERILDLEKPDRLLILGDTNSALSAYTAKRLGILVFHMEAGNRCYDDRVPEEVNRRIIDHSSDVLMPYTERSRSNLLREGLRGENIFVTGNPIYDVLQHFAPQIKASQALQNFKVRPGHYFLVTLHRAENVDFPIRLNNFIAAFKKLSRTYDMPVICLLHPRTRSQLQKQGKILEGSGILTSEPLGFMDFVHLEQQAKCVLTDSGTIQEECCIFKVPTVTLRDATERPETIEVGSNLLSGMDPDAILAGVETVMNLPREWSPPKEYLARDVGVAVVKIVLGYTRSSYGA